MSFPLPGGSHMLVLSRKSGQRILIGEDVEIVVLEIEGDQVKLGFNAPRYVPIFRAEVHQEWADCLAELADTKFPIVS